MEFTETNPFETDHFAPVTQDKEMNMFINPSPPAEFVPTMGEVADFSMDIPFPVIDVPSLGFPNLEEACQSRFDSDVSDSCPASPSPASSPSPLCSSSSSESGIEDGSDMEEASTFVRAPAGGIMLKKENPLSPLNSLNEALESGNGRKRNRRSSCKQTSHVSSVLAELNKLLVQTSMSATSTSMGTSLPLQSHPVVTGLDPLACIQTTATTTKASLSCPMSVQSTGQVDAFVQSVPISSSSQMVGSVTSAKMSISPPVASQSKTRSKQARNSRKLDEPKIVIIEEPEENYRARYESEGCRGPIHGSQENTFPTVKVTGYSDAIWITVHLTTSGGIPHYHSIHGPGSTKVPCKETTLEGGVPAVQVMVGPDSNMTAVLDSLSIRRLRNWEGDRELRKRGIDPRTWKKERKEARLLFQAEIPEQEGRPATKLLCKSKVFQCSSSGPPGNPEIWWASISEGSANGGDELGLIGKKFQSGFKVRFFSVNASETWESFAEVDKSKSHQGAAVVLTPAYCDTQITSPITVNVEVVFGNGRDSKSSEPIEFTYKPSPKLQVQEVEMLPNLPDPADTFLPMEMFNSIGDIVMNSLSHQQTLQPSVPAPVPAPVPVLPQANDEQEDWQALCVLIGELYQNGALSSQHVKDLCEYIKRRDTLLLQAFRSSKTAGTSEQLQANFKQYLSGMLCNL
ncbi:nuclear factor of activated T-cells, cytoplasmic 4-like isoform X4 [Acropora millepora]|uniref:nuclear factor of activated T-cells, cytoplasmic 4-like isoform X4 n=1 Tax=Acropora millepora TaxID=45264 RepID=UPI001CF526C7|nr:nuclear factor of activated T-cells, cytoplasmic 4-like isoform X4 [Acropora millepora]